MGLKEPGSRVFLSRATNPNRKLKYNWEFIEVAAGGGPRQLIGINTSRPNLLVAEALREGRLAPFASYDRVRPEVKYGRNSRVDFLLEKDGEPPCYLEVKNVHLMRRPGVAEFPDSVTARGARHLDELAGMVAAGHRAVMLFVVQIGSATTFALARDIDPGYGRAFDRARAAGIEAIARVCRLTRHEIVLAGPVPIER